MQYTKPPKNIQEQIELLQERGLIINDTDSAVHKLEHIGYFRFTGYCKYFQSEDNTFHANTSFDIVLDTYVFDRKLRLLTLDAIEKIEISFKSVINNYLSLKFGAFWYTDKSIFFLGNDTQIKIYSDFIEKIEKLKKKKSVGIFVKTYFEKYASEEYLPSWMLMEELTFGELISIYKILNTELREEIANFYGDAYENDFIVWLNLVGNIRNISAHHWRLWNRKFIVRPRIKDKKLGHLFSLEGDEKRNEVIPNYYNATLIIHYLLNIINKNFSWIDDLEWLFYEFPDVPKISMGFNDDSFEELRNM